MKRKKKNKSKLISGTVCCGAHAKKISNLWVCEKCLRPIYAFAESWAYKDHRPRSYGIFTGHVLPVPDQSEVSAPVYDNELPQTSIAGRARELK